MKVRSSLPSWRLWGNLGLVLALLAVMLVWRRGDSPVARGQEAEAEAEAADAAGPSELPFDEDANPADADNDNEVFTEESGEAPPARSARKQRQVESINIFSLLVSGGVWMIPIAIVSLLAVTFTIERFIGLRKDRVIPEALVSDLGRLGMGASGFDPRKAYRLCQEYPSAAANVIRAMLLKVGRPHSEVEHAVAEAADREANRLYANVRWLNFAAAVAPLLGLLGTVWGLIVSFHDTTHLLPGENKAEFLAKGIYIALVTTLAGLCVAIPAAFFSHMFEGRIQTLFHTIDELLFNLMPQVERYEGRVRFSRQMGESDGPIEPPPGPGEVAPPPREPRELAGKR